MRTLRIERSTSKDPVGFEQCVEKGKIEFVGFCESNVGVFQLIPVTPHLFIE